MWVESREREIPEWDSTNGEGFHSEERSVDVGVRERDQGPQFGMWESREGKAYRLWGEEGSRRKDWMESQGSEPHPPRGVPPGGLGLNSSPPVETRAATSQEPSW